MLEQILSPANLNAAYKRVKRNKGAGGVDEMQVESLKDYLIGRVISLIHRYLQAGVVVSHKFEPTTVGVPQGGPLSPLLSNIMLNELDKELENRGTVLFAMQMIL